MVLEMKELRLQFEKAETRARIVRYGFTIFALYYVFAAQHPSQLSLLMIAMAATLIVLEWRAQRAYSKWNKARQLTLKTLRDQYRRNR